MATQRDVARLAGVSVATVSRYINRLGYISPGIKKSIQAAIDELSYKPNLVARSLKLKKSRTIGLIFPDIENAFFISLIKSVEAFAERQNYNIILCNTENDPSKETKYLEMLKGKLVDGYIVIPSVSDDSERYDILEGENVVYADRSVGKKKEICVKLDNKAGVRMAVDYLVALGHRRIGAINVPMNISPGIERHRGYQAALAAHRIPYDEGLVAYADLDVQSAYEKTIELLRGKPQPSALLPMSNLTTIGALKAIKDLGMVVPHDISVIGFDEFIYAELLYPELTTIAQPAAELGSKATELLLRQINGKKCPYGTIELKPNLIVRNSCAVAE